MTKENFIQYLETLYHPYENPTLRRLILKNLDEYNTKNLPILFDLIQKNHYLRYGPPCPASIERIHENYQKENGKSLKLSHIVSATAPEKKVVIISDEERREVLKGIDSLKERLKNKKPN